MTYLDYSATTKIDKDVKVVLNSRYLLDVLNILKDEKVGLRFSNKLDPVVVKNASDKGEYTHIIMPLNMK